MFSPHLAPKPGTEPGTFRFSLNLHEHVTEEKRYAATRKWELIRKRKGERNLLRRNEDVNVGDEK